MKYRTSKWLTGALLLIAVIFVYFSGPVPPRLTLSTDIAEITQTPSNLEQEIRKRERNIDGIKPDNHARIIWADSLKKEKTPYCILYLHGFSATWKEADPVHLNLAKKYGFNLYLPRLYAHGLNEQEPLLSFDAEKFILSASQAISEAKILGEKIIIISTSTGGTASLFLASGNPEISALVLYSPNIRLFDSKAFVLSLPWGLQLARTVVDSRYYSFEGGQEVQKYWNTRYRIEALVTLKNLIDHTMKPEIFQQVTQPVLLCYYYKNDQEQDKVVSVPAMLNMYEELGTLPELKRKYALPEVQAHALASGLNSHDIASVEKVTSGFFEQVLKINR